MDNDGRTCTGKCIRTHLRPFSFLHAQIAFVRDTLELMYPLPVCMLDSPVWTLTVITSVRMYASFQSATLSTGVLGVRTLVTVVRERTFVTAPPAACV